MVADRAEARIWSESLAENAGKASKVLGGASILYGLGHAVYERHGVITAGDGVKVLLNGIGFIPEVGWVYAGLDIGSAYVFGTSITDAVGNAVDRALPNAKYDLNNLVP